LLIVGFGNVQGLVFGHLTIIDSSLRVCCGPKKGRFVSRLVVRLTSESVQGPALSLKSVDNVHGCDGLPLGMLSVGDGITDDVLEEHLEDTSGLFVDEAGDSLHTTTTSETTDSGLGDTLDVITKNFSVTLGAPLSKTFSSLTTSRHSVVLSE